MADVGRSVMVFVLAAMCEIGGAWLRLVGGIAAVSREHPEQHDQDDGQHDDAHHLRHAASVRRQVLGSPIKTPAAT